MNAMQKLRVERQTFKQERDIRKREAFGGGGMMGNVARSGLEAELETQSLLSGEEGIATAKGMASINAILEKGSADMAGAMSEAQGQLASSVMEGIMGGSEATRQGVAGGVVTNQQVIAAQSKAGDIVRDVQQEAAAQGLDPKEMKGAMDSAFAEAALAEALQEAQNKGDATLVAQITNLQAANETSYEKIAGVLKEGGPAAMALQMFQGTDAGADSIKIQEQMLQRIDEMTRAELEQVQTQLKQLEEQKKQREIQRDIKTAGGADAFLDRKKERSQTRNIQRAASRMGITNDPVRRGRAAMALASGIQEAVGGGMSGAEGSGLKKMAIEGNTARIQQFFDKNIKGLERKQAKARTPEQKAAIQGAISTMQKSRARAQTIATRQVENKLKLEEMPANIEQATQW